MVQAYNCGCHFVDSSFVLHYSNKGQAMALNSLSPTGLSAPSLPADSMETVPGVEFGPSLAENVPTQPVAESEKRKKKETGKILIFRSEDYIPNKSLTLDLISPVYTRQFCSLVEGCECFTCVRHTRGYINHLLITHELLAPTLLMLHNLFHVRTLLNLLKTKVEGGVLTDYEAALKKVFTPAN